MRPPQMAEVVAKKGRAPGLSRDSTFQLVAVGLIPIANDFESKPPSPIRKAASEAHDCGWPSLHLDHLSAIWAHLPNEMVGSRLSIVPTAVT